MSDRSKWREQTGELGQATSGNLKTGSFNLSLRKGDRKILGVNGSCCCSAVRALLCLLQSHEEDNMEEVEQEKPKPSATGSHCQT